MYKSMWLFRFISYSFCQGTRDEYEDIRLVNLTMPCEEWEARMYLVNALNSQGILFVESSITCLNISVVNS